MPKVTPRNRVYVARRRVRPHQFNTYGIISILESLSSTKKTPADLRAVMLAFAQDDQLWNLIEDSFRADKVNRAAMDYVTKRINKVCR